MEQKLQLFLRKVSLPKVQGFIFWSLCELREKCLVKMWWVNRTCRSWLLMQARFWLPEGSRIPPRLLLPSWGRCQRRYLIDTLVKLSWSLLCFIALFFIGLLVEDSELADVVWVSSGNNYEVGNMIAKVGCKGVFTLEEGKIFVVLLNLLLWKLLDLERGKVSTLMTLLLLPEVRPND